MIECTREEKRILEAMLQHCDTKAEEGLPLLAAPAESNQDE